MPQVYGYSVVYLVYSRKVLLSMLRLGFFGWSFLCFRSLCHYLSHWSFCHRGFSYWSFGFHFFSGRYLSHRLFFHYWTRHLFGDFLPFDHTLANEHVVNRVRYLSTLADPVGDTVFLQNSRFLMRIIAPKDLHMTLARSLGVFLNYHTEIRAVSFACTVETDSQHSGK